MALDLIPAASVGAAEGCDLLMLFLRSRSKDRSLRQLLQGICAIGLDEW
jgi:hypothetical protein